MHEFRVLLHLPPEVEVAIRKGEMERVGGVVMEWRGPEEKGRVSWLIRELATVPGLFMNERLPYIAAWGEAILPAGMASGISPKTLGRISEEHSLSRPVWEKFEGALPNGEAVISLLKEGGHAKEAKALESVLIDLESAMKENDPEAAAALLTDAIQKSLGVLEILESQIENPYGSGEDLDLSPLGKALSEENELLVLLEAYAFVSGTLVRILAEAGRMEDAIETAQTTGEYIEGHLRAIAATSFLIEGTQLIDRMKSFVQAGFRKALSHFFGIEQPEEGAGKEEGDEEEDGLVFHQEMLSAMLHRDLADTLPARRVLGLLRIVDEDLSPYELIDLLRGADLEISLTEDDLATVERFALLMDRVRDGVDKLEGYALELERILESGLSLQAYRASLASAINQRLAVVPQLPSLVFVELLD